METDSTGAPLTPIVAGNVDIACIAYSGWTPIAQQHWPVRWSFLGLECVCPFLTHGLLRGCVCSSIGEGASYESLT
jgi:hypothetical protein